MILDPPPRSRRSRYLWSMVVVVVVTLAVVVSASGEEARSELEYLGEIRSQAHELSRDGDILRDVVSRLHRIERNELMTAVEGIRDNLDSALGFVEAEPPTQTLTAVGSLYRLTLQRWDAGARGFVSALLTAADDPESAVALDSMALALAQLRAGDSLYEDLVAELERAETPDTLVSLPPVRLTPADADVMSLATAYTFLARQPSNRLALRPDLRVSQIVSAPRWELNTSNQAVIPATDAIGFSVVVSNVGNVASETAALVLTLIGGTEPVTAEATVDPLQPDQQTMIGFEDLDVVPGGLYEVVATLHITGPDADPGDNEIQVQFSVNEG